MRNRENKEKLALLGAIVHDIQERANIDEVDDGISKRDLTFCIDLLSRTVLAFLEERDLKNDSGMIEYISGNIQGTSSYLFGREYLTEEKIEQLLNKWGKFVK